MRMIQQYCDLPASSSTSSVASSKATSLDLATFKAVAALPSVIRIKPETPAKQQEERDCVFGSKNFFPVDDREIEDLTALPLDVNPGSTSFKVDMSNEIQGLGRYDMMEYRRLQE